MCFNIISYREYACGFRENTARQRVDCRRSYCRLSDHHHIEEHECATACTGTYTEDHHLIMDRMRALCRLCREAGRTVHPGSENNNAPGGILFKYVY
ncbi:hypothetical protein C8Q76DRAFT_801833 [Earliella scabrosa]|nr:hypothetical protein C8Q76DRAFT_801833 [Earliella scabrosa]